MILGHIAGVPVEESLAYVLPVVMVVGSIYWSSYRERRRAKREGSRAAGQTPAGDDAPESLQRRP